MSASIRIWEAEQDQFVSSRGPDPPDDVRDGWMYQIQMAHQVSRDGVCERADGLKSGTDVREDGIVRGEDLVRLADGNLYRKPVACWGRDGRIQPIQAEPAIHSSNTVQGRGHESLYLSDCQRNPECRECRELLSVPPLWTDTGHSWHWRDH